MAKMRQQQAQFTDKAAPPKPDETGSKAMTCSQLPFTLRRFMPRNISSKHMYLEQVLLCIP